MFLKALDSKKNWNWLNGVEQLENLGLYDDLDESIEDDWIVPLGSTDANINPHVFRVSLSDGTERYVSIAGEKAFLCSDENGHTLDIVLP